MTNRIDNDIELSQPVNLVESPIALSDDSEIEFDETLSTLDEPVTVLDNVVSLPPEPLIVPSEDVTEVNQTLIEPSEPITPPQEPVMELDEPVSAIDNPLIDSSKVQTTLNKKGTPASNANRAVVSCSKDALDEIKEYLPNTSFKNLTDLTIHIVNNWKSVFVVDAAEANLARAIIVQRRIEEENKRLKQEVSDHNQKKLSMASEIDYLGTQLRGQEKQVSEQEHQKVVAEMRDKFVKDAADIAKKVQDEAEKRLLNAFSQAFSNTLEQTYTRLLEDHKGKLLNAFTSKLMPKDEFFSFFQRSLQDGIENYLTT